MPIKDIMKKPPSFIGRLLMQAPAREDLRDRLKAVEDLQKSTGDLHLSTQFGEFINLLLKKKKIDKLRNLRKPRQR